MRTPTPLDHFDLVSRAMAARPAILHRDRTCSYAELQLAAERVAARLHAHGAGPGSTVGIALDRSIEWVIAMLGILKCGAAYLPLDPAYPEERLALYIADSGARHVICDGATRRLSPRNALPIDELAAPGTAPARLAGEPVDGACPGYLLYTSGSTGRPKGVVVSRDALAYQMNWFIREFACSAQDVFLHKTPTAFDASVWEYLAPLMVGATMVIADNTPDAIAQAARRHGATLLQAVPAMLQVLAEPAALRDLASLRLLFSGGEPLPRQLVTRIQAHLPIPVVNLYGPTEATVQCAYHACRPGDTDMRDPVPLGRPLPGTSFHIDADAADGSGELIIDGPGVASGYHGQPELTAARFGISPTGGRTYRSGDRVMRDPLGDYVFLGRTDNQVKLRGLRVEPEEIEHALLRSIPALRAAVAIVNDAQQIEVFLDIPAADWNEAAARAAMAAALPAFMQPLLYTRLDSLPALPNGKRDRAAVRLLSASRSMRPVPAATSLEPAAGGSAQATQSPSVPDDVAARVRAAWAGLLPLDRGDDSHFFRAGGHSLLAMQLIATLNRDFDLKLSAGALFAQPTLGALTRMVEAAVLDTGTRPLPASVARLGGPAGAQRVWFVHPAGGGIWCYRDIAQSANAMESYGIACEPLDDAGAYETDMRRMARRYAQEVLAQQPDGPVVLCGYSFGGNVAYEMAVHLQSLGIEPALLVLLDTYISRPTGADTLDFIASYARKLVNGGPQAPSRGELGAMPVGRRNLLLLDMGIHGGHLPAGATLRDVEQGLAMWIANNQAAETHEPTEIFEGPSLFIRCTGNTRDSLQGWPSLLKWLHVQDVAADHYTVYQAPTAAAVAALIEAAIQRSMQRKVHAMA